jgi:hypothetical protein
VPPVAAGPATQAEFDKKAARASILRETTAKLKAIDAGETPGEAPAKPRAPRKKAEPAAGTAPEKKPRAPRKKKADTE